MKKIKIALLGLGTVGTGVYKLIHMRSDVMEQTIGAQLEIKKILVHNLDKRREGIDPALLTDDWKEIVEDGEIQIVIEVIGGIEPARTMILEALRAGKNVVSANKDLIAEQGRELLDTAQESGSDFLFEAAVAGGIPIIRPLKQCLAANEITDVLGIVNGTTNYILTKSLRTGWNFAMLSGKRRNWDMLKQIPRQMWKVWTPEEKLQSWRQLRFTPASYLMMFTQKAFQRSRQRTLHMQKSLTVLLNFWVWRAIQRQELKPECIRSCWAKTIRLRL